MNYERLYSYRFRDIDQNGQIAVWKEIGPHVHEVIGRPQKVLDPAAGRGERSATRRGTISLMRVITAPIMDAERR
ncbi:MAG: hypothetical protein H0X42_06185 [Solirubrobacterales bacterium]|nr:hypothetical protein [Solirubrobacterales bacterium]